MRVGIDTLFEDPAIGTGGVTYIHNLVRRVADLDENEYVLYVSPRNRHLFDIDRPNVTPRAVPDIEGTPARDGRVPADSAATRGRRDRLDVFHAPGNIAPLWLPCASVLTVHTLQHWVRT